MVHFMLVLSIFSRTALDLAMAGGHRDVADYLISQGGPSGGGIFHRAALTIQAVWRLHRHRVSVSFTSLKSLGITVCVCVIGVCVCTEKV